MLDSLIFAFNSVTPIILMVVMGYILKSIGFINDDFSKMANKLVFRVFLPCMLFKNVYTIESISSVRFGYIIFSVVLVFLVFGLGLPTVILLKVKRERRGALLQSFFRSNYALIGLPLAESLFPGEGASVAALLSAVSIPLFNMLAVIALSVFGNESDGGGRIKKVILGIVKNPLIVSVFIGLLCLVIRAGFVNYDISFRLSSVDVLWKTVSSLSNLATPLALLVLGAQFKFSVISELRREIVTGVLARCLIVPLIALGSAYLLFKNSFNGAEFAALVALFVTPVAVSSVPMAQEMGSDASLAGQLVVFTTIVSSLSIFFASLLLRLAGIF